jgi:SAM-dependent methyltransferase
MSSSKIPYDTSFYSRHADVSYRSAKTVLPVVQELIQPKRIVDVGCGVGTWLRAWEDLAASSVTGVDGSYVKIDALQIDKAKFIPMDLVNPGPVPGAPFDLAQSLEVGEHLPEQAASRFVKFLCSLSDVVLFGAAIPHQGGTHHINEQWPEYWAELFDQNGFSVFDVIRPKIWNNKDVAYYYAQNSLLFVNREHVEKYPRLHQKEAFSDHQPLARVHPNKWTERVNTVPNFEDLITMAPESAFIFGKRAIGRLRRLILGRGQP